MPTPKRRTADNYTETPESDWLECYNLAQIVAHEAHRKYPEVPIDEWEKDCYKELERFLDWWDEDKQPDYTVRHKSGSKAAVMFGGVCRRRIYGKEHLARKLNRWNALKPADPSPHAETGWDMQRWQLDNLPDVSRDRFDWRPLEQYGFSADMDTGGTHWSTNQMRGRLARELAVEWLDTRPRDQHGLEAAYRYVAAGGSLHNSMPIFGSHRTSDRPVWREWQDWKASRMAELKQQVGLS